MHQADAVPHGFAVDAPPLVRLRDLSLEYKSGNRQVLALHSIHLDIQDGDFICILGPSGCGKSTLLRILAGFLRPTAGQALLRGQPIAGPDAHRGVVFQQPNLYPWFTVAENVELGPRLRGVPKAERDRTVQHYLEQIGLWQFRHLKPYELSGGMQQRVAIARALANDPDIVLMDEPFGALDALTRDRMQDLLLEIWRAARKTILFITHSVEEAIFLGTRVLVMSPRPGRFIAEREVRYSRDAVGVASRTVRADPQFIALREELLGLIWGAEASER